MLSAEALFCSVPNLFNYLYNVCAVSLSETSSPSQCTMGPMLKCKCTYEWTDFSGRRKQTQRKYVGGVEYVAKDGSRTITGMQFRGLTRTLTESFSQTTYIFRKNRCLSGACATPKKFGPTHSSTLYPRTSLWRLVVVQIVTVIAFFFLFVHSLLSFYLQAPIAINATNVLLLVRDQELRDRAGGRPIRLYVAVFWEDDMGGTRSRKYSPYGNFRFRNASMLEIRTHTQPVAFFDGIDAFFVCHCKRYLVGLPVDQLDLVENLRFVACVKTSDVRTF